MSDLLASLEDPVAAGPMDLLASGVPLTLLIDLFLGVDSEAIMAQEKSAHPDLVDRGVLDDLQRRLDSVPEPRGDGSDAKLATVELCDRRYAADAAEQQHLVSVR